MFKLKSFKKHNNSYAFKGSETLSCEDTYCNIYRWHDIDRDLLQNIAELGELNGTDMKQHLP